MPKTITEEILEWSEKFLEIPSKKLGGWSVCPYAKAARLKNEVKIEDLTIFQKRAPQTNDLLELIEQSKHPVIKKLEYDLSFKIYYSNVKC